MVTPETPLLLTGGSAGTYQLDLAVIYPTQVQLAAVSGTICQRQNGHAQKTC